MTSLSHHSNISLHSAVGAGSSGKSIFNHPKLIRCFAYVWGKLEHVAASVHFFRLHLARRPRSLHSSKAFQCPGIPTDASLGWIAGHLQTLMRDVDFTFFLYVTYASWVTWKARTKHQKGEETSLKLIQEVEEGRELNQSGLKSMSPRVSHAQANRAGAIKN